MNQKIIDLFTKLIDYKKHELNTIRKNPELKNEVRPLSFKINNYQKAKKIISEYSEKITSGSELKPIKGIGPSTIKKIDEILATGTLSELPSDNNNLNDKQNSIKINRLIV